MNVIWQENEIQISLGHKATKDAMKGSKVR